MNKDYEKIIEFICNSPEIPEDLAADLRSWMLAHSDDENLTEALRREWDLRFGKTGTPVSSEALGRLLREVAPAEPEQRLTSRFRRLPRLPRLLRYAAIAAAICLSTAVGYFIARDNTPAQTILMTAKGSMGEFTLPDGSTVRLNSDTRLCYDADSFKGKGKRRVSVEGEAFFDVTKDPAHPFVVEMTEMEVEVLGTSFDVRNYPFSQREEVVLLSGSVKVESKALPAPVTMHPDQRFTFDRSNGRSNVEDADAINYCRWINKRLKLENEPLGDLLITISRKYGMDLEIAPGTDISRRVSITLGNDEVDELMPVISYLTGLEYSIDGHTLRVGSTN